MAFRNPKRRSTNLPTKLAALSLVLVLVVAEVYAACTYTTISQSSITDANMCPTADGKFFVGISDTIKWSSDTNNTLVETSYVNFRCATDTAVITRTSGVWIESDGEPWIDYDYYKIELAYRTTNAPNTKFVVAEQYSLSCPRTHPSPVVVNFDNRSLQFTSPESGVEFDLAGDGLKERVGWTRADAEVAFLIRGVKVTDGRQLFGNLNDQAPAVKGSESANGYRALRVFDLNGDGAINAADPLWQELNLWFDRNHNGVSEPEEVEALAANGVVSISLDYVEVGKKDQFGNLHRQRAKVNLAGGSSRWSTDVYPAQSTAPTSTTTEVIRPRVAE